MTDRKAGLPEKRFQFGRRIRSLANRAVTADRVWLLRRPLLRRRGEAAVIGTKPTTPVPELFGDVAEPPGRGKWWLWFTFFGFVVLPTLVAFSYYGFIASRQYESEVKFVVRGTTQIMPGQGIPVGGGAVSQAMRLNNSQEGAIISSYIQSEGMFKDLAKQADLMHIYGRPEVDWLSRLSTLHPFEKSTQYWLRMVSVHIEPVGGIITLRVAAFSPEEARNLARLVLMRCESLVSDLLAHARNNATSSAELELRRSLNQTAVARKAFEELRDTEKLIDADDAARSLLKTESKLSEQKVELETQLTQLKSDLSEKSPVIRDVVDRINSIDKQILNLHDQLTKKEKHDESISNAIRVYERRKFDLQLAEENQDLADKLLLNARRESQLRHVYLEVFEPPDKAIMESYPFPLLETARLGAGLFIIWLIGALLIIRILEHTD